MINHGDSYFFRFLTKNREYYAESDHDTRHAVRHHVFNLINRKEDVDVKAWLFYGVVQECESYCSFENAKAIVSFYEELDPADVPELNGQLSDSKLRVHCKDHEESPHFYESVDLISAVPSLRSLCKKNSTLDCFEEYSNVHCSNLNRILFYARNLAKHKDDCYFKRHTTMMITPDNKSSNMREAIGYHLEALMQGENLSVIIEACNQFEAAFKNHL